MNDGIIIKFYVVQIPLDCSVTFFTTNKCKKKVTEKSSRIGKIQNFIIIPFLIFTPRPHFSFSLNAISDFFASFQTER